MKKLIIAFLCLAALSGTSVIGYTMDNNLQDYKTPDGINVGKFVESKEQTSQELMALRAKRAEINLEEPEELYSIGEYDELVLLANAMIEADYADCETSEYEACSEVEEFEKVIPDTTEKDSQLLSKDDLDKSAKEKKRKKRKVARAAKKSTQKARIKAAERKNKRIQQTERKNK